MGLSYPGVGIRVVGGTGAGVEFCSDGVSQGVVTSAAGHALLQSGSN